MAKKRSEMSPEELEKAREYDKKRRQLYLEKDPDYYKKKQQRAKEKDPEHQKKQYQKRKEKNPDYRKKQYQKALEKDPDYRKKLYQKALEKDPDYCKKKYQKALEKDPDYCKKKYQKALEKDPDYQKKQYQKRKEKDPDFIKKQYKKEKERYPDYRKKHHQNRMNNDKVYSLRESIRNNIRTSFKKMNYPKKSRTYQILGCSFEDFKQHIENQFEPWMNFDNYGLYNGELNYGWDLDHIIAISSATTEEEVIKLNHYTNFQPLCSKINRDIKRDNLDYIKNPTENVVGF